MLGVKRVICNMTCMVHDFVSCIVSRRRSSNTAWTVETYANIAVVLRSMGVVYVSVHAANWTIILLQLLVTLLVSCHNCLL